MSAAPRTREDRARVWVVEPGERLRLAEVLRRLGQAQAALAEGRVFVEGRRVLDPALCLEPGQRVELYPARRGSAGVELLEQRDGLVAALKPAELPTEPDHHGLDSLRTRVAGIVGIDEARLHAVSRLDVGVTGVVLLAYTAAALRQVESARRRGALRRRYVGIAERAPRPPQGSWDKPIDSSGRGRMRVAGGGRDGLSAETRYAVVGEGAAGLRSVGRHARPLEPALLAFEPRTGRTHQIRVHAAHAGAALLGDRLYGGVQSLALPDGSVLEVGRIALHAAWVELTGPGERTWRVGAPAPQELLELWRVLGGAGELWETAGSHQYAGLAPRLE
jgi:23S rRNA-/tRNA-specific pseudouridylate synthase